MSTDEQFYMERDLNRIKNIKELEAQLAAEQEVGHNQAVTLGQHIARLEDQLAAAVIAIKRMQGAALDKLSDEVQQIGDAALTKLENK